MNDIEIIEFVPPKGNRKNLYVRNIPPLLSEIEIYTILYEKFSVFGLVYEIQLFPLLNTNSNATVAHGLTNNNNTVSEWRQHEKRMENVCCVTSTSDSVSGYYAFVKFYSVKASQNARVTLNETLQIGDQQCKVVNAKRKKDSPLEYLALNKCHDLANFYLGFNGWTTSIKLSKQNTLTETSASSATRKVCFYCLSVVSILYYGITSEGFGAWEETYSLNDNSEKSVAYHKARKISYQRSLVDAFSKILLLVLPNGKVVAELNSSKPDIFCEEMLEPNLIQINELDNEPEAEDSDSVQLSNNLSCVADTTARLDDFNIQLLQELED